MKHIRKIKLAAIFIGVAIVIVDFSFFRGDTSNPEEQLMRMPQEEREFSKSVLGQITSASTASDVEVLLGKPTRDHGIKKNWWVAFGNRKSRVGVYFSFDGYATEIVLDGDGYYYRRNVPRAKNTQ